MSRFMMHTLPKCISITLCVVAVTAIDATAQAQRFRASAKQTQPQAAPVQPAPKAVEQPVAVTQPVSLAKPGQVDTHEVQRWGNRVVVTDGISKSPEDIIYSMAMAPPADDSDMWIITIWGPSKDSMTLGLVKSFEHDPYLAPFVAKNPNNGLAWAHLNVIHTDDVMQAWRVKKYGIVTTPVITIMPPRNGHKGDPNIVVDRIDMMGASGAGTVPRAAKSPAELQKRITNSIQAWSKKLATQGFQPPKQAVDNFYGVVAGPVPPPTVGGHQQAPPWGPTPPPATPVNPQWPVNGPAVATDDVLSLSDIMTICPSAPIEFLITQSKATDKNAVLLAWLLYQQAHPKVPPVVAPVEPPPVVTPVVQPPVVVHPADPTTTIANVSMVILMVLKLWEVIAPMLGMPGTVAKQLEMLIQVFLSRLPSKT